MSNLLIYTFATGRYSVYADLWKYCIKNQYPEYDCKVVSDEGFMEKPTPYFGACIRFLDDTFFVELEKEYEYFYITDVDMFILREEPTLLDFHLKEMVEDGQCFSNARRGPGEPQGVNRLTGLHFMHKSWFDATRDARMKYLGKLLRGEIGHVSIDDELILAKIVTESGLKLPPQRDLIARHHGIHLGTVRDKSMWKGNNASIEERRRAFITRMPKSSRNRAQKWQRLTETQEYRLIINKINNFDRQAVWELNEIYKFTAQMHREKVREN